MDKKVIIVGALVSLEALKHARIEREVVVVKTLAEALENLSEVLKLKVTPIIEEIKAIQQNTFEPPRSKFIHKPRNNFKK